MPHAGCRVRTGRVSNVERVHVSERLAPVAGSAARARTLVDESFASWGCADLAPDARLVAAELVANAVCHAATTIELGLELADGYVRVSVADRAGGVPIVEHPGPDELGGRGMQIVERLSDSWGFERRDGGKVVWARWRIRPPRRRATAEETEAFSPRS